eukprot:m51a1_g6181 hypothetical protein (501) ;mRNA; r:33141-34987
MMFLGDALLEGRLPGSRGESLAAKYLASHLSSNGLCPAGDSHTFFQAVPLVRVVPSEHGRIRVAQASGPDATELEWSDDYVGTTSLPTGAVSLASDELVFVGYGISDPSRLGWDDYKGASVEGKVVVSLVSQPTTGPWAGKPLAYPGRWTYKLEEAARRRAKAVLLVHTLETASYPWAVVRSSWSCAVTSSPGGGDEHPLEFAGWVTQQAADRLARLAGSSLSGWLAAAQSPDFRPIALGLLVSLACSFTVESFCGTNTAAVVEGSERPDEAVVVSAHVDHLGTRPSDGAVFCGALDNASGVAVVLAGAVSLARAVAGGSAPRPRRSVVFVFPTAEETGMLGSAHFARCHPEALRGCTFLADLNVDVANAWGETEDACVLGRELSTLGSRVLAWAASQEGMALSDDPTPPASGFVFRGDQYSFVKAGVPAVWVFPGQRSRAKGPEYTKRALWDEYFGRRYHQPEDVYTDDVELSGMAQHARLVLRAAYGLAVSDYVPVFT